MKHKKDLIIAVLATFCLTATIFMVIPIRSSTNPYDPLLDYNHDGKIGLSDLVALALSYGGSGDPQLNVTVTNLGDLTLDKYAPDGHPYPPITPTTLYIYSAPFLVSANLQTHPSQNGLGPGVYETDILVHNPSSLDNVSFSKKLVVAYNETVPHQSPIWFGVNLTLGPDQDFRIDSKEIDDALPNGIDNYGTTNKGYVCIISNSTALDVVAFYTVSEIRSNAILTPGNTTSIESLIIPYKIYSP
jgi:hypothetical protein